jgi:hypothetical protein
MDRALATVGRLFAFSLLLAVPLATSQQAVGQGIALSGVGPVTRAMWAARPRLALWMRRVPFTGTLPRSAA